MKSWFALGFTVVAMAGCSKKSGDGGGPSAFGPWIQKDAATALEGAWIARMQLHSDNKRNYTSAAGDLVALEIKGAKATASGDEKDQELTFILDRPCEANFDEPITEGPMKGGTAHHSFIFVMENGQLVAGSGAAGYRKGKTAVVCSEGVDGGVTLVDDKGRCQTWDKRFNRWESTKSACEWSQKDGKDVLTIGTGDWKTVVYADGDVLKSQQFSDSTKYFTKVKDYADAKAQIAAKRKADDPGEKAKAMGGVPGKTDNVLSLIATFSSDPSLKGKTIELTAQYLNSNSSTSNGKTTHNVMLVDGKDKQLSIACDLGETAPPDGLVQYDTVTAKGTVGEAFGLPELEGCTVAKAP